MIAESNSRSVVKAISYRVFSMSSDFIIVFLVTHQFGVALSLVTLTNIGSTIIYFIHERTWSRVGWGRLHNP